ncbi:hypothetical protein POTOM_031627 [Populus tomentosa]|uniref:GDT1 family protein n=1 Tax=Populus tomentosa TaxID=118781 RepID=A0A8X7Z2X8_POPTO|nr:hypothetical protein POTOM_031627 [Populus tomentosa]
MENMTSVAQGFTKSLAMTVLSEIGDKTFFAAAFLEKFYELDFIMRGKALRQELILVLLFRLSLPYLSPSFFGILALGDLVDIVFSRKYLPGLYGHVEFAETVFILAMRHPRRLVLSGCLSALIVMTILSASVGWAAPNLISRAWTHHISTILFFGFGLWSLWDGFNDKGEAEELAEVEAKLDADWKANTGTAKAGSKDSDELKKQRRTFLSQFFSPILLKDKNPDLTLRLTSFIMRVLQAFSITFFGEWGDKSQIATIGLAADENPFGVVMGGIVGHALCTTAAVIGGKTLASQISEKIVALSGGVLFIVFGIQSFLSTVE